MPMAFLKSSVLPQFYESLSDAFIQELYEPFWDELYRRSRRFGFSIRSIWIADVTQQGMSGVLNEGKLGNDRECSRTHHISAYKSHTSSLISAAWIDHARDLLHVTNHFRQQMPRPLIGIGHSMGGNQLYSPLPPRPTFLTQIYSHHSPSHRVNLSLMHPRLFTTLVLLDPVIQSQSVVAPPSEPNVARASTFRRDLWPSRAAAAASFAKSPF